MYFTPFSSVSITELEVGTYLKRINFRENLFSRMNFLEILRELIFACGQILKISRKQIFANGQIFFFHFFFFFFFDRMEKNYIKQTAFFVIEHVFSLIKLRLR